MCVLNAYKYYTGIRGFANMEECAIGAAHSLDAFNFLSGLLFAVVFLTVLIFFLIQLCFRHKNIGTSLYYSFYIASQVYGEFDEFQQGQVNCSSSIYYSSFVSVIIVFNYVFVVIALIVLLYLWYN